MGAFKLGKMTFGSLFKKPETVMYPIESKPQPAGLKGHIAIDVEGCILCGMCERSCSTDCITVDKQARTWTIDRLQCVQCGYCITVCPKKCLHMDPNYAPATTVREAELFAVPDAGKPVKKTAPAESSAETPPKPDIVRDAQLEALLDLMEGDKAEKVRSALG